MTGPTSLPTFHALRFGRAAARYDAQAGVQAQMADALLSLWGERAAPARILEFGCGTGLLTRRLRARFPDAVHVATDAASGMLEHARRTFGGPSTADVDRGKPPAAAVPPRAPVFQMLDARGETAAAYRALHELAAAHPEAFPADLVAAGALVQWFPDLAAHLRFAASAAGPGAAYLVSGFGRDNFPELNALLAAEPFAYRDFPGHAPDAVEAAAGAAGWAVAGMLAWEHKDVLPGARAVLQRVRDLGAVRDPRTGGRMTRARLAFLIAEYERRFAAGPAESGQPVPVSLTWKPWAALLVKA